MLRASKNCGFPKNKDAASFSCQVIHPSLPLISVSHAAPFLFIFLCPMTAAPDKRQATKKKKKKKNFSTPSPPNPKIQLACNTQFGMSGIPYLHFDTVGASSLLHPALSCSILLYPAPSCSILLHPALSCSIILYPLPHTEVTGKSFQSGPGTGRGHVQGPTTPSSISQHVARHGQFRKEYVFHWRR